MAYLDTVRAVLFSKYIDPNDVKPYTGLHINTSGDIILTTPSLDSYRVNNDPLYPYERSLSADLPKDTDYRILSYDKLENVRYQSLRLKQPTPNNVTRIFHERFGPVISPRADPSRTIRVQTAPGYRLLVDPIPTQDQTMISQRFNKISPFVTDYGTNINANPILRQSLV